MYPKDIFFSLFTKVFLIFRKSTAKNDKMYRKPDSYEIDISYFAITLKIMELNT